MAVELRVPQMGESISEATIFRWLVKEGDAFPAGAELVELETDKANTAVPAEQAGVLERILRKEGETVVVNEALAILAESNGTAPSVSPRLESKQAVPPADAGQPAPDNGRPAPHATPLARSVAAAQGVDLSQVQGSGISGRILSNDVKLVAQTSRGEISPPTIVVAPKVSPAPRPEVPAGEDPRIERRPMSRIRQTIARNLMVTVQNAAILTTFNEVDMSAILEIRKRRKEAFEKRNGVGLGFMSFFTKATIGALKAFPLLNAEIDGSDILVKHFYDIGIAVSTKDGLVVPIVRDADKKSFAEIEKDIVDLAGRARERKLSVPELQGGTFTITNGGIFGSLLSTPILAYPQVGILGMHKIQERPIALNGEVVIRPMMYLALSYDHRIVDGSEAVRFLVRIKEMLEDPETLLLEG